MELALKALGYALILLAVAATFRYLARRFPAAEASAQAGSQARPTAPKGYTACALAIVLGGFALAGLASFAFAALGQRLAERGDCSVACFGGSALIWLLPWFFAGLVIVGLLTEMVVRRVAPHVLETWRRYDEQRTGVNWRSLEKPVYVSVAIITLVITLLGVRYTVRFGASETELHRFFMPGTVRLPHSALDSIIVYDCVRLRDGGCKPQSGVVLTWRSGMRLSSTWNLYDWRHADERFARRLAQRAGAGLRIGGVMPR